MAIGTVQQGGLRQASPQTSTVARMPAPTGGLDDRAILAAGDTNVAIYAYNIVPKDGGMGLRRGYREWQIGLDNGNGISVNTIIPYDGTAADDSLDRVFAVTNEGIWDVTTASGTPTLKITFADQTEDAGFGVFVTFVTDAGAKLIFYADSLNGLYKYTSSTDTWVAETSLSGVDEAQVNFVTAHKGRLFFIERDSTDAYYLPIGAISGATSKFIFGNKFRQGGLLQGLFSWSVDGGKGVDDYLVGLSSSGDVMVYEGTDPSDAANWSLRGNYFIGTLPKGPKVASEQGGEMYILSTFGAIAMTDLLNGVSVTSADPNNTSAKIASLLRGRFATQSTLNGWSVRNIPSEGGLLISSPTLAGTQAIQYYYNLTMDGWGLWRGLDVRCFQTWKNAVMFGDGSLRVCYMDRELDEVKITPPTPPEVNGAPIEYSMLTSFSGLGNPAVFKRVKMIRPDVITTSPPAFDVAARYDYAFVEAPLPTVPLPDRIGVWDVDGWDAAVWGAGAPVGTNSLYGASGIGRNVAVAYRGKSYVSFTLVGFDVVYDSGSPI